MKFSIRDLFLVTVIVALALGWWLDRSRLAKEIYRMHLVEYNRVVHGPIKLPTSQAPAPIPPKK